ncbi:tetratricopeptide repeat protein [Clostridium ganghwense]|uniref:Tetratricopeptide repeat protein n=1 Tax=Clostridium ganghwense TaxID=312089 RepID=A0ABT4CM14_9CLOT|nr:hypothetical protein [Clostridium ganghwense]MCY6370088.1 hypothetical protein [Clostridium ganghwense]
MNRKFGVISIVLTLGIFSTGCAKLSTPAEMIKPPKLAEEQIKDNSDLKAIARKFLPEGAKLLAPNEIVSKNSVYELDVDNDKEKEVVVFFKLQEKYEKGFFVLKNKNNQWTKIFEKKNEGNMISMIELINVHNSNEKSLIVGTLISGRAGSVYQVYTFKNGKVSELNLDMWNKFEILNTPDKNKEKGFVFGVGLKEASNIYGVNVIRFDGKDFYFDDESYPEYFKEAISYYKDLLKEENKVQLVWYYLIESQIKANLPQEALKSIEKVFEIKKSKEKLLEIENHRFYILKGEALNKLGRYKEAEKILSQISIHVSKLLDYEKRKALKNNIEKNNMNIMTLQKHLSDIYLQRGKALVGQNNKTKAKEDFDRALNILENLSKEGYFGQESNVNIIKSIIFNNVKSELNKIK